MKRTVYLSASLALLACGGGGSEEVCIPGQTQACFCGGGRLGVQECDATDRTWSKCDCWTADADTDADTDVDTDTDADTDADPDLCGNGRLDDGELCDGNELNNTTCEKLNFYRGSLRCTKHCTYDIRDCDGFCGDGLLELPEECEGYDLSEQTCQSFGYYRGTLKCGQDCSIDLSGCEERCGDGVVNGPEQCDGPDIQGQTCEALGYYSGSTICADDCTLDYSDCSGYCGDGNLQTIEECEGEELRGETCQSQGYYSGDLDCTNTCIQDTSGCSGFCGDGEVNGNEECDGDDLAEQGCGDHGFYAGVLICTEDCSLDTSNCREWCGDHVPNGPEVCDDGVNDGSYGSCEPGCAAQAEHCGDGEINGPEECDDDALAEQVCQDFAFYKGELACGDDCKFDTFGCSEFCGDGKVNGTEECDDNDLNTQTCADLGFSLGILSCSNVCSFNTSLCATCVESTRGFQECSTPDGRGGPYVVVPESDFWMGCNENGLPERPFECLPGELPQHEVHLSSYGIDKYEVAQADYKAFIDHTGHAEPLVEVSGQDCGWDPVHNDRHPVVCVTWNDMRAYCQWLGGDLPTEAQWEYSARGLMTGPQDAVEYPWLTKEIDCDHANCKHNLAGDGCSESPMPVGSFPLGASPFGLMDLAGNVREWVLDWYDSGYYSQANNDVDPTGPNNGDGRVNRGGAWGDMFWQARSGVRERAQPEHLAPNLGARCRRPAH